VAGGPRAAGAVAATAGRLPSARLVRCGLFLAVVAWSMAAGKDMSWDVVNHHLYLPFSWLSGRYRTDLFGAGAQAYQNPLGYFPLYGLLQSGAPAWFAGLVLGATHALVVWPLDRIARSFWPTEEAADFWCRTLALALCLVSPVFLLLAGTSSIDPSTSLLVVWAVALSLQGRSADEAAASTGRAAATAGALVGLASAAKLSNAVFAVALCGLWLLKCAAGQAPWRRLASFAAGLAAAFAAGAAWWMAWLWHDFGNPVFPLFNPIFHSPYAPPQALASLRFVPESAWAMVTRLLEMTESSSFVAFEAILPDGRPLLAALAASVLGIVLACRGDWRRLMTRAAWRSPGCQLALFMLLSYVLWMRSSGNARYALPLFVLVGIPLARALQRLLPLPVAKMALLTLLLLQGGSYACFDQHRFAGTRWDAGPYIDFTMPRRLREQPFLHLTLDTQTNAAAALFLARGGALANPTGDFALPTDGPLGERLQALMDRWRGRTRLLFNAPDAVDPADIQHVHAAMRLRLQRLGVDVDWADCEPIKLLGARHEDRAWATDSGKRPDRERDALSCGVVYRTDKDPAADARRAEAEKVFAILEAACPRLFAPTPFASEQTVGGWQRHYLNTEANVTVSRFDGVNMAHFRMMEPVHFGTIDDILQHRVKIQCPTIQYKTPV